LFRVALLISGLQVAIEFAEGNFGLTGVAQSRASHEDGSEYRLIERFQVQIGSAEFYGTRPTFLRREQRPR
jgi:hypothetical protein